MALATQCPHCGTMFRVASDQLKLRGGIVRCGSCQEIFDGSATLVDLDAVPAPAADQPPAAAAGVTSEPAPAAQAAAPVDAPPAAEADADALAPLEAFAVELPRFDDQPVYTLDFDHTFDPFGILPKVDAPDAAAPEGAPAEESGLPADVQPTLPEESAEPAPEAATPAVQPAQQPWSTLLKNPEPAGAPTPAPATPEPGRIEPAFGLPVDEELVAAPLPGHEPEPEPVPAGDIKPARAKPATDAPPLLKRESTASVITPAASYPAPPMRTPAAKRAEKAAARRSKLTPTKIEPQPKLRAAEIDEPEFVKRGRQQEQNGRTRKLALLAGAILLLVLLFAQGALTFRNALAARYPSTKGALVKTCALFGCRVELPAQVDNLVIETGELTTLGGGAYSFTTELRNQGGVAQAWPSLELALTDANDKPLVRRVFAPKDYLASGTPLANGIPARAEQAIKLHFRVDDLKPSGYHIAVFYP